MRPPSSGEPGQQVEHAEGGVDEADPRADPHDVEGRFEGVEGERPGDAGGADEQAGQRSGGGDPALGPRRRPARARGGPSRRAPTGRSTWCRCRSGGRRRRGPTSWPRIEAKKASDDDERPEQAELGVEHGAEQRTDEDRAPVDPQRGPGEAAERDGSGQHGRGQANRHPSPRAAGTQAVPIRVFRGIGVFRAGLSRTKHSDTLKHSDGEDLAGPGWEPGAAGQDVRARTTVAQLRPLAPHTPAPGNVAAPVRNSPGTAVS